MSEMSPEGFHVVTRLSNGAPTAEQLWQEAVAPRLPVSDLNPITSLQCNPLELQQLSSFPVLQVIVPAELQGVQEPLSSKWTNAYLKSKAVRSSWHMASAQR